MSSNDVDHLDDGVDELPEVHPHAADGTKLGVMRSESIVGNVALTVGDPPRELYSLPVTDAQTLGKWLTEVAEVIATE